jgi:hypothetical protein
MEVPMNCLAEEDRTSISTGLDLAGQAHDVADQIGMALGLLRAQNDDRGLASIEPQANVDRRQPSGFELYDSTWQCPSTTSMIWRTNRTAEVPSNSSGALARSTSRVSSKALGE